MSDYRPVRRSAPSELKGVLGKHVWLLLHVASGKMAAINGKQLVFTNKGDAVVKGQRMTFAHLNPEGLTSKQIAKAARRADEAAERDKAFEPHVAQGPDLPEYKTMPKVKPKRKAAAKPAGTSRPGRVKGTVKQMKQPNGTTGRGKVKAPKGTSAKGKGGVPRPRGGRS